MHAWQPFMVALHFLIYMSISITKKNCCTCSFLFQPMIGLLLVAVNHRNKPLDIEYMDRMKMKLFVA